MPKICPAYRWPYSLTTGWLFLSEQVIASTYLSVTTVALLCVIVFRTAPPVGGISFNILLVRQAVALGRYYLPCTQSIVLSAWSNMQGLARPGLSVYNSDDTRVCAFHGFNAIRFTARRKAWHIRSVSNRLAAISRGTFWFNFPTRLGYSGRHFHIWNGLLTFNHLEIPCGYSGGYANNSTCAQNGDTASKEQEAHQLVGEAKRRATKIRLKAVESGFLAVFRALINADRK